MIHVTIFLCGYVSEMQCSTVGFAKESLNSGYKFVDVEMVTHPPTFCFLSRFLPISANIKYLLFNFCGAYEKLSIVNEALAPRGHPIHTDRWLRIFWVRSNRLT
jgi:hypothetical protein